MARWRLTQKHYVNTVPPTKYRYEETDRDTGERNVQEYDVPRLLDPESPRDCRSAGVCVVSDGKGAERGDWIITGDPTPDMEPIDEAAEEISAGFADRWKGPMSEEAFPSQGGFGGALLANLEKQLTEAFKNAGSAAIQPTSAGVDPAAFKLVQEQLAALMAKNAELEKQLAAKAEVRRA